MLPAGISTPFAPRENTSGAREESERLRSALASPSGRLRVTIRTSPTVFVSELGRNPTLGAPTVTAMFVLYAPT